MELLAGNQVRIIFSASGTETTNYQVETSPRVGRDAEWTTESRAQFMLNNGNSGEATFPAPGSTAFFRIFAVGGDGGAEAIAHFSAESIQVDESQGVVNIELTFDKPFQGRLFYTVIGSTNAEDMQGRCDDGPTSGVACDCHDEVSWC
jgi:hypothetical protein